MNKKITGSYYTPERLADYIVYRLFGEVGADYKFDKDKKLDVLEPSVGGGMFLASLLNGNYYGGRYELKIPKLKIDAVEIDPEVAQETQKRSKKYDKSKGGVEIINDDYLGHFLASDKKYDLIIGNPPYVRRRNMEPEQRELCAEVHKATGLRDINPKNLWTSFLAGSKESLKEKGVIAFILPTDLLQVKYSEEIREMLLRDFDRVEIFTFNWLAFKKFDDIEQDVVILICSNGHGKRDEAEFWHINSEKDLDEPKVTPDSSNTQRSTLNKWTNYALTGEELEFLDYLYNEVIKPKTVRDYCDSGAGIVTAANDYFIISRHEVDRYSLGDIAKPTIKKSSSMLPAVVLTEADLDKKEQEGSEILFVDFPDKPKAEFPKSHREYLKKGEQEGIHQRYKMLLRDNWYVVPSVWSSEAFFTKRSHLYPRVIINEGDAYVTDAFYRIRMKEGYDLKNLTFSFYNTFTFIYAELMGRYYGGGVLELTPNEFKDLPLPYINGSLSAKLKKLDRLVRNEAGLEKILDYTDSIILMEHYGLSEADVKKLRVIYRKLLVRRLKKDTIEI
ncbi:MAG: Eco57I restriction-modification methylase domain-containing protein [Acidobacteriota bacterium]